MTLLGRKHLWLSLAAVMLVPVAVSTVVALISTQTTLPKQPPVSHKLKSKITPNGPSNIRELNVGELESRIKGLRAQRLQLLREFTPGSLEIRANELRLTQVEKELAELKRRGLFELLSS